MVVYLQRACSVHGTASASMTALRQALEHLRSSTDCNEHQYNVAIVYYTAAIVVYAAIATAACVIVKIAGMLRLLYRSHKHKSCLSNTT